MKRLLCINFIALLCLYSCNSNQASEFKLVKFSQFEHSIYLEELGINWNYRVEINTETEYRNQIIKVYQNLGGGMCKDNFEGKIFVTLDTLFLLADYKFNTPEFSNLWEEVPVNNCTSNFEYKVTGNLDLDQFKIVFVNELSDLKSVNQYFK